MVRFVEAENGETYLWQKYYIQLPGLGELPGSSYVFQKLKENPVPEAVQAAWDARNGKIYLCLNEKYSSQALALALPAAGLASLPGYMAFDRIVDENYAEGVAVIPGLAGRDWQNVRLFEQDGVEYAQTSGMLCMDAVGFEVVCSFFLPNKISVGLQSLHMAYRLCHGRMGCNNLFIPCHLPAPRIPVQSSLA